MDQSNNFVLLEHVNLNVTDRDVAVAFYEKGMAHTLLRSLQILANEHAGLGLTINPKGVSKSLTGEWRQVHFNAGLSQFHCAWMDGDGSKLEKNVFSGSIYLQVLSLQLCQKALENLSDKLPLQVEAVEEGTLKVCGPYGNHFLLTQAPSSLLNTLQGSGQHPGGFGSCIVRFHKLHYALPWVIYVNLRCIEYPKSHSRCTCWHSCRHRALLPGGNRRASGGENRGVRGSRYA